MCSNCGHEFGWHGDRAVCPCDGGWSSRELTRWVRFGQNGAVALCNCPGWSDA